jgi:hypothetical protein
MVSVRSGEVLLMGAGGVITVDGAAAVGEEDWERADEVEWKRAAREAGLEKFMVVRLHNDGDGKRVATRGALLLYL